MCTHRHGTEAFNRWLRRPLRPASGGDDSAPSPTLLEQLSRHSATQQRLLFSRSRRHIPLMPLSIGSPARGPPMLNKRPRVSRPCGGYQATARQGVTDSVPRQSSERAFTVPQGRLRCCTRKAKESGIAISRMLRELKCLAPENVGFLPNKVVTKPRLCHLLENPQWNPSQSSPSFA